MDSLILTTDSSSTHKEKLINENDENVWKSFEKLEQAKRSTIEMENVSIEISRQLNSDTEKMKGIRSKLDNTNREISTSSGVISRMMRLQRRNKIFIALFSLLLIASFLVILYVKLTANSGNTLNNS